MQVDHIEALRMRFLRAGASSLSYRSQAVSHNSKWQMEVEVGMALLYKELG